jgi:hypothetical protein
VIFTRGVVGRAVALLVALGGTGGPSLAQPSPDAERVRTELLDVRAPAGSGWRVSVRQPARVAWARPGTGENDAQAAFASVFRLTPPRDGDHLLSLVRDGTLAETPAERFRPLQSTFMRDDSRGAPCVRHVALHEDTQARLRTGGTGSLVMQSVTLYCLHPVERGLAIAIGWSHRGMLPVADAEAQGEAFLAGADFAPSAPADAASAPPPGAPRP